AAGPADPQLAALRGAGLPPEARAIADNAAAIVAAIRARAPGLRITLDPVEFRGLQYHVGVAFTLYGPGNTGELARGGRYRSGEEAATGMTLYPDAVRRAAPAGPPPRRVFLPLGSDPAAAARLRMQGFITVAALSSADTPRQLRCGHILRGDSAAPIEEIA
ncbi:ATP phosphoribosyltransferase regulatory subunit, partial [Teichococcus aestuarii]|uniref:ATP phosphoribosyltransferase regulatory subunit n=1 Tax=Teichococcus aestuarii TaxID=568898 RepID=UPI00361C45C5